MAAKKSKSRKQKTAVKNPKSFEILSIVITLASVLLMMGLYFEMGSFGKGVSHFLRGMMGSIAYVFPIYLFVLFIHAFIKKDLQAYKKKYIYSIWLFICVLGVFHFYVNGYEYTNFLQETNSHMQRGTGHFIKQFIPAYWARFYGYGIKLYGAGILGEIVARPVILFFGKWGAFAFFIAFGLIFSICVFDISIFDIFGKIFSAFKRNKKEPKEIPDYTIENKRKEKEKLEKEEKKKLKKEKQIPISEIEAEDEEVFYEPEIRVYNKDQAGFASALGTDESEPIEKEESDDEDEDHTKIIEDLNNAKEETQTLIEYEFPSLSILTPPSPNDNGNQIEDELKQNSIKLVDTLQSFGVRAKVTGISMGPTVTRYELAPEPGVKVSKIVNLSKDIALSLAAKSVRIEAPIPGKRAVGIELANKTVNTVTLREVLETEEFKNSPSKLSVALGKDICGSPIILDIAKMPHLLIAGATGAGKSVCINTIIMSILYKADPNEVKLVMVDPKVVELGVYNGAPHLLIPVVTDPKKAAGALNWAVSEMTDRYEKFAENNVRDIKGYNELMVLNETPELKMPQIVIIIDELADLMMVAPSDVETYICRLAQMARAAGMHLVIATQRPSVNVITGTIKANIPSRISFMVSNQIDSRTILDMAGAEKLIGRGDMLYMPVGASSPTRLQCSFVTDKEVESVVNAVSANCQPHYKEDVMERLAAEEVYKPEGEDPGDNDELLPSAIELAIDSGSISTSLLQRRFRIGYNRAGSIVDQMEARGIISGPDGNKPRQVLITRDEYNEMIAGGRM